MKNITITLDRETARLAHVRAAERDMSLSRYLGELVRKDVRDERQRQREARKQKRDYAKAMRSYLSRGPFKELAGQSRRYVTRDELHDRAALRRK